MSLFIRATLVIMVLNCKPLPLHQQIQQTTLMIFCLVFPLKIGFYISCKFSPEETIYMKCQRLFSERNKKKYFKMLSAERFTQHTKC